MNTDNGKTNEPHKFALNPNGAGPFEGSFLGGYTIYLKYVESEKMLTSSVTG